MVISLNPLKQRRRSPTSSVCLQCIIHKMGLSINIKKTKTMSIGTCADFNFNIDGKMLAKVDRFKYLGSYITRDCKMDEEIKALIQVASCAVGRLRNRVFDCRDLTTETKLKVYNQCVIPLLMY